MVTQFEIDLALMAGRTYQSNRDPNGVNWFPVPAGWTEFSHIPNSGYPTSSGFEAASFQRGSEIVIAFAGTDQRDLLGDMAANLGLATGLGSTQLVQAADYALRVKAANPLAQITFTGHSLGGGLAALLGVFFGQRAVTFDQAPFARSATKNLLTPNVAEDLWADLKRQGWDDAALQPLTDFLAQRDTAGGIPNAGLVSDLAVAGELLSGFPYNVVHRIGNSTLIKSHAPGVSGEDLHTHALLTVFLQSMKTAPPARALHEVTDKLPHLLELIFSRELYRFDTDTADRNFLEHLIQNEQANGMVTRFTRDLGKLAQDGGLTVEDGPAASTTWVSRALIAFAMQKYYEETIHAAEMPKEFFTDLAAEGTGSGGVRFDMREVAPTLEQVKGYALYFREFLSSGAVPSAERQLIATRLPEVQEWYVQAGPTGMTATDSFHHGALLLGGSGADHLTGGKGNDLVIGQASADVLAGGAGPDILLGQGDNDQLDGGEGADYLGGGEGMDVLEGGDGHDILEGGTGPDTLNGGAGVDTYLIGAMDGTDTIEDSDGRGIIKVDGAVLGGAWQRFGDRPGVYHSIDGQFTFTKNGSDLVVTGTGSLTIKQFTNGMLGIRLVDLPAFGEATRTEFVKIDSYRVVGRGANGLNILEPVYVPFFTDESEDMRIDFLDARAGSGALTPAIDDRNNLIRAGGGNDFIYTDAGDDQVYGEDGDDSITGLGGNDRLYGGAGNDTLTGYDPNRLVFGDDYLDGGDGADLLLGGAGADRLVGGMGNDHLESDDVELLRMGLYGNDVLDGGEGDDELHGAGGDDVLNGGPGNDLMLGDLSQEQNRLYGCPRTLGADVLDGGSGDDWVDGLFGPDVVVGGTGNDTVIGADGNDVLDGGDGNDRLSGDLRLSMVDDLYVVSDHRGEGGDDWLSGGPGIDDLTGGEGADTLLGGEGNDWLYGDYDVSRIPGGVYGVLWNLGGDDELDGGDGNDMLKGGLGDDWLWGGDGNDQLEGGSGNDKLFGGAGDDALQGGEGNDVLEGGDGVDNLQGNGGIDVMRGGAGNDYLFAGTRIWAAEGGEGEASASGLVTTQETDVLFGDSGDDYLSSGNEQFDTMYSLLVGGEGDDTYVIDSQRDTVVEEPDGGTDTVMTYVNYTLPDDVENAKTIGLPIIEVRGNRLANILSGTLESLFDGGAGNDTLINGGTYVFGHGYDHDTIVEYGTSWDYFFSGKLGDVVRFTADVTPSQVRWQRQGEDLVITLDGGGDTLTIPSFYTLAFSQGLYQFSLTLPESAQSLLGQRDIPFYVGPSQIERFEFADGTVWGPEAFDATRIGNYKADTYEFGRGDGHDTLLDFDWTGDPTVDVLRFKAGIAPEEVEVSRVDNDLVLGIKGTEDHITVKAYFFSVMVWYRISTFGEWVQPYRLEQVVFADGTVWDSTALEQHVGTVVGTEERDVVGGNEGANTVWGLAGPDWLYGFGGNDVLNGGAGDDMLLGGTGDDTYVFNRGDGTDTIEEIAEGGEGNQIRFGPEITQEELAFIHDPVARTLTIHVGTGGADALVLTGFDPTGLQGSLVVEALVFDDGSKLPLVDRFPLQNALRVVHPLADHTGAEDEPFSFTIPADTFAYGDATSSVPLSYRAQLADGRPLPTWLDFDPVTATFTGRPGAGTAGSLHLTVAATGPGDARISTSFVITITGPLPKTIIGTKDNDTLTGARGDDTLRGLSGHDRLLGLEGNDWLDGGAGRDDLAGGEGEDRLDGGAGDDLLDGGMGNDDLQGGTGDDTYLVDSQADQITEARNAGRDMVISSVDYTLPDHTERLELNGSADLTGTGNLLNNVLTGNSGNNQLMGQEGQDVLEGGAGNDRLDGGAGRDHLVGGEGDDTYLVDVVKVGGGRGRSIRLEDTIEERKRGGTDTVVLRGRIPEEGRPATLTLGAHLEAFDARGTGTATLHLKGNGLDNTLTGNEGDNRLVGLGGNDTLRGGPGNDVVQGGTGNDTILFGRGDGQDRILDDRGEQDMLLFDAGITSKDLILSRQANDLRIAIQGTTDHVTIQEWYTRPANRIETIEAGNGQVLLSVQVDQLIQAMGQFTTDTGLSWEAAAGGAGTPAQQELFQGILAANWQ